MANQPTARTARPQGRSVATLEGVVRDSQTNARNETSRATRYARLLARAASQRRQRLQLGRLAEQRVLRPRRVRVGPGPFAPPRLGVPRPVRVRRPLPLRPSGAARPGWSEIGLTSIGSWRKLSVRKITSTFPGSDHPGHRERTVAGGGSDPRRIPHDRSHVPVSRSGLLQSAIDAWWQRHRGPTHERTRARRGTRRATCGASPATRPGRPEKISANVWRPRRVRRAACGETPGK